MRPIDADALKEHICNMCDDGERECKGDESCAILCWVNDMPTVEATPIRRGRWIEKPPYNDEEVKGLEFQIVCSWCDEQNSSITFDENSVPIAKTFYRTRYCPHCGSMNLEADNG